MTPLRTARPRPRRSSRLASPEELLRVARHEAGHAVMAIALGCRVGSAIIHATGDGQVLVSQGRGRPDPVIHAMVCWAGPIAEGPSRFGPAPSDLAALRFAGLRPDSIERMRRWTRDAFDAMRLWPAIVAVAPLLLARVGRRVPGPAIHEAVATAAPWLVGKGELPEFRAVIAAAPWLARPHTPNPPPVTCPKSPSIALATRA